MAVAVHRTRRRQPPEETRRQIIQAALEFLRERSFRELSVDALMARTGHTRTLFYHHFDDIPALLLALIAETGGELLALAEDWSASGVRTPQEARRRLASFVDFHTRNAAAVRAVVEAAHHNERVEQAYGAMVERFVEVTSDAIQARVDGGELPGIDAPEMARALVLMVNGYLVDPLRTRDPDRALETLVAVWTRTLFPAS
ncbi:MAG TPA: TetR/AcrR family transcriptional regulator [Solirubrobacteraceae bacterium]|nr:TetR/AcrR family transcriptional regulator [Solirubrobacteraceae bacterium]